MKNKPTPRRAAVLVTFAVAFSATFAILLLRGWADHASEATLKLTQLHRLTARLDALEYRGIAAQKLEDKYLKESKDILTESRKLIQELPTDALLSVQHANHFHDLTASFENYSQAIEAVFGLLAKGDIQQAKIADEARLDAAHDHLEEELREQTQFAIEMAKQKNLQADLGTILTILTAGLIIGWALQKIGQATRLTEVAQAEQKLLQASEAALKQEREQLETRVQERTQE
jgi:hypothetical protein